MTLRIARPALPASGEDDAHESPSQEFHKARYGCAFRKLRTIEHRLKVRVESVAKRGKNPAAVALARMAVTNCTMLYGHGGVVIASEMSGGVSS